MAGFHSSAGELETAAGAENPSPCWVAAKMAALPCRQPCQATHTRPLASVDAAGKTGEPGAFEIRTVLPGTPFAMGRAHRSKSPFSFADQNTHGRPDPSTAIA